MTLLKEIHKEGCIIGKRSMRRENQCPSFFLLLVDGKLRIVPTPWSSPEEKPVYIAAIRAIIQEYKIPAYCFVTEAWVASVDPRTQKELMNIMPRDRSDREDVLMVFSRHRDGENYATKYVVDYDEAGTAILRRGEQMKGDFSDGLMGNLFEPGGARPRNTAA